MLFNILRKVFGTGCFISFFWGLGLAGKSDCGAPWEEIFPNILYALIVFVACFVLWELFGGNQPYKKERRNHR